MTNATLTKVSRTLCRRVVCIFGENIRAQMHFLYVVLGCTYYSQSVKLHDAPWWWYKYPNRTLVWYSLPINPSGGWHNNFKSLRKEEGWVQRHFLLSRPSGCDNSPTLGNASGRQYGCLLDAKLRIFAERCRHVSTLYRNCRKERGSESLKAGSLRLPVLYRGKMVFCSIFITCL